ncbi:LysR family transcriptional regulator [Halobacillus kuroshimensis]|uniref:LysR family transcriptional regulator n=1 Tax=Halobacillus kuroshimensis TaxID=302481 RepID=A0ABS3DX86_9BACI|nr:LysR family transcriptional regulator [Halobacillus kuroshimensis]MBN8235853.1 LysR family transcriptional regulator [Halobacillus kuroshimensis]
MDEKQLVTFLTAAETLNFTKTASMLNFAQSSVTAQIKSLEVQLGRPLFERLGRKLVLTEAGHQFKGYAEKMVKLSSDARLALNGEDGMRERLTIGAQESQCTYRLPPVLKAFKSRHPHVELIFKPAHSDAHARRDLMDGRLDAAFIMDTSRPEESLTIEPLLQEDIKLVAGADYRLKDNETFQLSDIEREPLLLTEEGCSYRSLLEQACAASEIYPFNKLEFGSIEAIKQCVIAGLGIAALPHMVVERELTEGRIVDLGWKIPQPPLFTQLAWHKDKWLSPPLKDFIDISREFLQEEG